MSAADAVDAIDALLAQAGVLADAGQLAAARALLAGAPALATSSLLRQASGVLALRAEDCDAAIAAFTEACRLEPDIAEHRGSVGLAYLEKARRSDAAVRGALVAQARAELEAALALGPITPHVASGLAFALEASGEPARALAVLDELLVRVPDDVPALFNRASALKALGRIDDARALLDDILRRAPGFPPALAARARLP